MSYTKSKDPNYDAGLRDPALSGQITKLINAAIDYAATAPQPPEDRDTLEDDLHWRRFLLEQAINDRVARAVKRAKG